MEQLAQQAIEFILGLRGPVVYAVVGLLTWAEAPFFLGLVTPGEIAMAVGGVLASRGQVVLGGVGAAAAVGTILGNTTGYWLGRRWGAPVLEWAPLQRFLGRSIDGSRAFFERRGEWAIVVGQFVSYIRIFVPFLVGASGMPFRRYLAYALPTAVVWSVGWVVLGFVLGEWWRGLQEIAGPASFLVLILFLLALAIRWVAVWIARRRDRVEVAARWLLSKPPLRWIRSQLRWLAQRFDPRIARGLSLTVGLLVLLVGAGAAGIVLSQVENVQGIALLDFPVLEWMAATRTDEAVLVARTGLQPFRVPSFLIPTLLLVLSVWWQLSWGAAARAMVGMLGSGFGAYLLDQYVLYGVVPEAGFPSVPVVVAAALLVHATAAVGARHAWGAAVAMAAVGLFLACAVALATIVAGWAAPSGIVLGFAIGLTWSTSVELSVQLLRA